MNLDMYSVGFGIMCGIALCLATFWAVMIVAQIMDERRTAKKRRGGATEYPIEPAQINMSGVTSQEALRIRQRLHPHASIVETIPADGEKPAVALDHSQAVQDMSRDRGDTGVGY